jgi:protein-tyrosine phosphatase
MESNIDGYSDYDEIIPNLFIGNFRSLKNANKFAFIVNCTDDIPFPKKNMNCLRISIKDGPTECDRMLIFMKRFDILEKIRGYVKNKEPVLVHCYAGIQRSCAVVACYLMKYYNISPLTAIDHIKMKRPYAFDGGVNFQQALYAFYDENKNQ